MGGAGTEAGPATPDLMWADVDPVASTTDLLACASAAAVRLVRDGAVIVQGPAGCCVVHSRPSAGRTQYGIALVPNPEAPGLDDVRRAWAREALAQMAATGAPAATFPLRDDDLVQVLVPPVARTAAP